MRVYDTDPRTTKVTRSPQGHLGHAVNVLIQYIIISQCVLLFQGPPGESGMTGWPGAAGVDGAKGEKGDQVRSWNSLAPCHVIVLRRGFYSLVQFLQHRK